MTASSVGMGRQSERVLETLRSWVDGPDYQPGDRLPTEREISSMLRVSRPTVRRAMMRLQKEGRIEIRQGSGAYVRAGREERSRSDEVVSLVGGIRSLDLPTHQRFLLDHDCVLCVYSQDESNWDTASERRFLQRVLHQQHRALLCQCSPVEPFNDDVLAELANVDTRVIHISPYRMALPDQEYLLPDYEAAGYRGAVSLMLGGYSRVCNVALVPSGIQGRLVQRGFERAMDEYRGGFDPERDANGLSSKAEPDDQTIEAIKKLVESSGRSCGMLCRSHRQARALMAAAQQLGYSVPDELGILSITLPDESRKTSPTDTMWFDSDDIVRRALAHAIEKPAQPLRELVAPDWRRAGTVRVPQTTTSMSEKGERS